MTFKELLQKIINDCDSSGLSQYEVLGVLEAAKAHSFIAFEKSLKEYWDFKAKQKEPCEPPLKS